MRGLRGLSFLFFEAFCGVQNTALASTVNSNIVNGVVTLENGYTKVEFDENRGQMVGLYADFNGTGSFTKSILASPFGTVTVRSGAAGCESAGPGSITWNSQTPELKSFTVSGITDCATNPLISEDWTVTLREDDRYVNVSISGKALRSGQVTSVSQALYLKTLSLYALFDRGVSQMMGNDDACMGSNQTISDAYFMGGGFGLDLYRDPTVVKDSQIVLHSNGQIPGGGANYSSGFEEVILGTYPDMDSNHTTAWSACWSSPKVTNLAGTETWERAYSLGPNNYDFPLRALPRDPKASNLAFFDLQTYLTGLYGSPVGCLQSYFDNQIGIIAPTISHAPDTDNWIAPLDRDYEIGYTPNSNFFDPDNFMSVSAMIYSGDAYLLRQVREVLVRTGETMCGIGNNQDHEYCDQLRQTIKHENMYVPRFHGENRSNTRAKRAGQLMHHFIDLEPTYASIAESEQLGPNIFWTWSVLRYISMTQDKALADQLFPYIDLSTQFLLTFFDEKKDLINAPGPLWIDVLVRENYTSDSAPIFVPLLTQIADFYDYLGKDANFANSLRDITRRIAVAMNKWLWSDDNDHFITQLNPDGTKRDFIDYDSNLLSVAFGVANQDRVESILKRVDSGPHTHIRATWATEIKYSGDAEDCYIVGGDRCGDSTCTLARIGYIDAIARKKVGDLKTFNELLLEPLQNDLAENVWLFERYDENATQIRTSYYFEYPSLVTMMLREQRYGINVGLKEVVIEPFPIAPFSYKLGQVEVEYSSDLVSLKLIGDPAQARPKDVKVFGLSKDAVYAVNGEGTCPFLDGIRSDRMGSITIPSWTFKDNCVLKIKLSDSFSEAGSAMKSITHMFTIFTAIFTSLLLLSK